MNTTPLPTLEQLSSAVGRNAVVWCETFIVPELSEVDAELHDEELLETAHGFAARLPYDEDQANFLGDSSALKQLSERGRPLPFARLRFSMVMARRARGELPRFIAASAIPVDYARRTLVLDRRGPAVKTYPGAIHTVGGAFAPQEDDDLLHCLVRECREEADIELTTDLAQRIPTSIPSILVGEEVSTGSVQVVFLHRSYQYLDGAQRVADAPDEGTPLFLGFDELPNILEEPDWVPSGRLHVLVWLRQLAYDATRTFDGVRFDGLHASELLAKCMDRPWTAPDNALIID